MSAAEPRVSVVIPAFNQARFLPAAIDSALAQTYRDREIIVVDDGSTDETPEVARRYGDAVRYVRQANKGLAGARNTGIERARGEFVALLDSDDVWLPDFLAHRMRLAEQQPKAAAYYGAWRYIDSDGRLLPEPPHAHVVPPADTYRRLLKANFIVPSTVVMRRAVVLAAGLFDERFRRLEDWELWVRLLRGGHSLAGSAACKVHYREHGQKMSMDWSGMGGGALELAKKHFGEDDGRVREWPRDKRWAYGGVYRYRALLSAKHAGPRGETARALCKAFTCDSTLVHDRSLYYELVWGSHAPGTRRLAGAPDVRAACDATISMLSDAVGGSGRILQRRCLGHAHLALAWIAYGCGEMARARHHLADGARHWPPLVFDARFSPLLVRSCLGARVMGTLKRLTPLNGRSR